MTVRTHPDEKRERHRRAEDQRHAAVRRELEAARRVSEELFLSCHHDEVVRRALEIAVEVVDADGGSILLATPETGELVFRHSIGVSPVPVGTRIPWNKGIAGAVFGGGESVIIHDVQRDERHFKGIDLVTNLVTKDLIASPLRGWGGGSIGVLEVINKRGGLFHDQDLSLVSVVSAITASAIERARLDEEAKLAAVGRLVAGISHDIKNLLTPIVCGAEVIAESLETLVSHVPPSGRESAEKAGQRCRRAVKAVTVSTRRTQQRLKEITDCIHGLGVSPRFSRCSVAPIVRQVFETLEDVARERGVALLAEGLDGLPELMADEGKLFNAFYNLVNNALVEVPPGGSVTVGGEPAQDEGGLAFRVADTGRGMAPEVRDRLFTGGNSSRKHLGSGLGTRLVKDVIDAHGGRIAVESAPGRGTTFNLFLPFSREGA